MLKVEFILNHNGQEYALGIDMSESYNNKTLKEEEFEELFKAIHMSLYVQLRELNVFIDTKKLCPNCP